MKSKQTILACWMLLSILVIALSGCATPTAPASAEKITVRIAALPIVDALPFYVAQKESLFAKQNITVEFIPVGSAAERDQVIQSKQADGMINDMVSVALYNKDSVQLQIVRFARIADAKSPMYRILAAKNSAIQSPADLAGVPIGMSQGTVIDYVTSRMLEREGLKSDQIKSIAVPKMDQRLALLGSGELKAATLPEPFGTIAQGTGATIIVDDSKYPEYANSVLSFRKEFIDAHPQAVKGFLQAIEQAVTDITQNGESFRPLFSEYKLIPQNLAATYPIPSFQAASLPTREQFLDAVSWAKDHKLIQNDVPYEQSVNATLLKP